MSVTKSKRPEHASSVMKYTRVKPLTNAAISTLFIILGLICLLPAVFVTIISFTSEASISAQGYSFLPQSWSLEAYQHLWKQKESVGGAFMTSVYVTVLGTFLGLVLCGTMGYGLSRPSYFARKFFSIFIFIPMLFSGGLVASYMINTQILGLKNSIYALIIPLACSSFYVIIMRTFFQTTVPESIIESAKMDGAQQLRIFLQIVLPISLPAMATVGLFFTFMYWNEWTMALYYLDTNHSAIYPLQYVLISIEKNIEFLSKNKEFMSADTITRLPSETIRMAIVIIAMVPIACSYPFFQRYFISGLTIGAVKG